MRLKSSKMLNRFSIFLLLLFSIQIASAGSLKFRKYAGEFMNIGVAARAQGMGGAFAAISGDIAAAYYNPAGIIGLQRDQISIMHTQQLIASVNYDFLAYGHRQGENRVWAVSLVRLGIDNIKDSRKAQEYLQNNPDKWRINWDKVTTFNAADYVLTMSVAQNWKHGWVLGGNLKLIRRDLADHSANGFGFDLGLQRQFGNHFTFGASLWNATSTLIAWDTGEKELVKPSLHVGGAFLVNLMKLRSAFRPVGEVIIRAEGREKSTQANLGAFSFDFLGGLEYSFHEVLFIRTGIDEISRFNVGAGVKIPHIRIDYAFTNYDSELGNSHRIGLVVTL